MKANEAVFALEDDDPGVQVEALQALIDSGAAWRLEGSIGRAAMAAIEDGVCMLGEESHRDYWGNYVPSRHEVVPGTKGSPEFVAERQGE
jgi:hypothetical protein